jgi:hypothetical protein
MNASHFVVKELGERKYEINHKISGEVVDDSDRVLAQSRIKDKS